MVKQLLASRANSSVKKYVTQYGYFSVYLKSRGVKLVLPCDSLLVSEYLSYLHETKRSRAVLLSAFCALKWVHDLIPYGAQGNPVDTALNHNLVQASKRVFSRPVNKTHQFRQGNKVFIAKSGGVTCPHSLLSRYLSAAGIDLNSSAYIFRTLQPRRKNTSYTLGPRRLSYTRCREFKN